MGTAKESPALYEAVTALDADLPFCGVWVPACVFDALRNRHVEALDVTLLMLIDAHTAPDTGCPYSQPFFADWLNVTKSVVTDCLNRLESADLVKTHTIGGRVYLATSWDMGVYEDAQD